MYLAHNHFRPLDRDGAGDGECRSNEDCRESWAPFCSEFGYCRSSDRYGTRNSEDLSELEYQYEDYGEYENYEDYYYVDDYENESDDIINEAKQDPRIDTEDIVELTDKYVAPLAPEDQQTNNSIEERNTKSHLDSHTRVTLQDFGIFPELRPPPLGDSLNPLDEMDEEKEEKKEDEMEEKEKKVPSSCPGGNIRDCVDGCVPLAQLWVYSVCVRECARRCP